MPDTTWYVVTRADNKYPQLIYANKARADHVVSKNGGRVVPVQPKRPS